MIVAFARYPLLGKVKTRLAAGTGNEQALELYKLLLKGTIYQMTRYGLFPARFRHADCSVSWGRQSSLPATCRCTGVIAVVACADVSDCVRMRDWLAQSGLVCGQCTAAEKATGAKLPALHSACLCAGGGLPSPASEL